MIAFTVLDFSVYHDSTCSNDRFLYYDGSDKENTEPEIYCGYYIYRMSTSSGNTVHLEFFSDGIDNRRGFKIAYETVNSSTTADDLNTHVVGEYCRQNESELLKNWLIWTQNKFWTHGFWHLD